MVWYDRNIGAGFMKPGPLFQDSKEQCVTLQITMQYELLMALLFCLFYRQGEVIKW